MVVYKCVDLQFFVREIERALRFEKGAGIKATGVSKISFELELGMIEYGNCLETC